MTRGSRADHERVRLVGSLLFVLLTLLGTAVAFLTIFVGRRILKVS